MEYSWGVGPTSWAVGSTDLAVFYRWRTHGPSTLMLIFWTLAYIPTPLVLGPKSWCMCEIERGSRLLCNIATVGPTTKATIDWYIRLDFVNHNGLFLELRLPFDKPVSGRRGYYTYPITCVFKGDSFLHASLTLVGCGQDIDWHDGIGQCKAQLDTMSSSQKQKPKDGADRVDDTSLGESHGIVTEALMWNHKGSSPTQWCTVFKSVPSIRSGPTIQNFVPPTSAFNRIWKTYVIELESFESFESIELFEWFN